MDDDSSVAKHIIWAFVALVYLGAAYELISKVI